MSDNKDFWNNGDDWDNFSYEEGSYEADEDIEVEVEYETEEKTEYEDDVNTKRRLIVKKGAFFGVGIFLVGVGNALFKKARKWKRD
jgi:hypothetical protein